jgi:Ca-activated chloride channel family protein
MNNRSTLLTLIVTAGCSADYSLESDSYGSGYDVQDALGDNFQDHGTNPWVSSAEDNTSTFSVDVDTASYALTRRALTSGRLPDPASVRVEEFVNAFRYDLPAPTGDDTFAVHLESGPSPFGESDGTKLLRIGLQSAVVDEAERKPANLVFLLDVSGSMASDDKLGLVKYAMKHLVQRLHPTDTLGIVVYAGSEGVLLEPTAVSDRSAILDALDGLQAGGSTAGEAGIRRAYDLAEGAFREDGVNRVVLCTDGDFNVGLTGEALVREVERFRDRGIFLTTLGFGMGNLNDATMEQLSNRGDGNYAYIDTPNEALRTLGEHLVSTLQVVAKDVKLQVTFDPQTVQRWRLIGYENRLLNDEDFEDDDKDAGDVGAGHGVTAYYEVDPVGDATGVLAEVALRWKQPEGGASALATFTTSTDQTHAAIGDTSNAFRFGAAVAEFAEILRESPHSDGARFTDVHALAEGGIPLDGADSLAMTELLSLVDLARTMDP